MKAAVVTALLGLVVLAVAKPPPPAASTPPGSSPWAAYATGKAGPFKGRSIVGLGMPPSDTTWGAAAPPAEPSVQVGGAYPALGGPLSPFFKLKPFLTKPTFMPPVVDPSQFVDMKAGLLNSLFNGGMLPPAASPVSGAAPAASPVSGAAPAAYSGVSTRALLSPFAAPALGAAAVKPPPPAFLADLFKALNINKTVANATDPIYPAVPAFPPYPSAPLVDPGVFISKKAKFLSDLFAGIATTTPAVPPPTTSDTDALNAELTASLQRLLASLSGPADAPEDEQGFAGKAKRAANSGALVTDAKDKVVDTIIGELAELKNSMVGAVTDLASAQRAADAAAAAAAPKKPLSPYAAFWAKPTAPAPTGPPIEPVRQKVVLLGQVFDMLTNMEKDIAGSMTVPPTEEGVATENPFSSSPAATPNLMDIVKAKIVQTVAQFNASNPPTLPAVNGTPPASSSGAKSLRVAGVGPTGPPTDPTFWIPDSTVVGPDAYLAKTKQFLANIMATKSTPSPIVRRSYKPSYFQQQEPQQEQRGQPQPPQQQWQPAAQPAKLDFTNIPAAAAIAYQLQQLQHHHHHNRQPFWWN